MSGSSPDAKKAISPAATRTSSKNNKSSKIVTLKLSSYLLTDFPHQSEVKSKTANTKSTKQSSADIPNVKTSLPEEKTEKPDTTSNSTGKIEADPLLNKDGKRRGIPGPKPGQKRTAPATEADGNPKPRGKPGPKKRKVDSETGVPPPAPAPKLGPKANQGAINAGLRALDRTGKKCRRWGKRTVTLKSFTGVVWDLPYWQTPKIKRDELPNDVQSQETSSSEPKNGPASSQVASESGGAKDSSNAPVGTPEMNGAVSESMDKPVEDENSPDEERSPAAHAVED